MDLSLRDTHFPYDRGLGHKEIPLITRSNSQCDPVIQLLLLVKETPKCVTDLSRVFERLATISWRGVNCESLVAKTHGD